MHVAEIIELRAGKAAKRRKCTTQYKRENERERKVTRTEITRTTRVALVATGSIFVYTTCIHQNNNYNNTKD
jgi:hypothetical protein